MEAAGANSAVDEAMKVIIIIGVIKWLSGKHMTSWRDK